MKKIINWNPENKATLEHMYDEGYSDRQITATFGCGAWAVAKQRSILGLIKHKKREGIGRQPKTVIRPSTNFTVLMYFIDAQKHYASCYGTSLPEAVATKMLNCNKEISSIIVLKPTLTVTRTGVTEHI